MRKKDRYEAILQWFRETRPIAETELEYDSPFHLLVAVVLSAQCTDKRVNMVTKSLFKKFNTIEDFATAEFDELFPYIKSISYPNNKTKHLIAMSQKLLSDFNGEIPSDIESLMTLPGVGRKTANVIASIIYNQPVIAVDTHVFRVSHRLGLSDGKTVDAVEKDLEKYIQEQDRTISHHWLILHGRYTCLARSPHCDECGLKTLCRKYNSDSKNKI